MRLSKSQVAIWYCGSVLAIWPRLGQDSSKIRLAAHTYEPDPGSFIPREILEPKSPKPELYQLALTNLKRLGKESTCHQLATKLYVSSCQLFQELESHGEGTLVHRGGGRLQDYIDSFAISRAICDLETAQAVIPYVCESFREPALLNVMDSKVVRALDISHEQIGQCMKGLHSDQKSWTSYNSNRESAELLCRASRLDIDKDDFISTAQAIVNILREVKLADEQRRSDQVDADLATSTKFQNVRNQLSDLRERFLNMWHQVSEESAKAVNVLMASLRQASSDADATNSAIKRILVSLMEGNAEHALAQESAMAATSGLALVAQSATHAMRDFHRLTEVVGLNITEMAATLAAIDRRHIQAIEYQDTQVRELLNEVQEKLHDVKRIISDTKADAESTARSISIWALEKLPEGPWCISWPLLIVTPVMTVVLVGYGIPASYIRNVGLSIIGVLIAKSLTLVIHGQWDTTSMTPSSLSQLARNRLSSSLITVPVELEFDDASIFHDIPLPTPDAI